MLNNAGFVALKLRHRLGLCALLSENRKVEEGKATVGANSALFCAAANMPKAGLGVGTCGASDSALGLYLAVSLGKLLNPSGPWFPP